MVRREAPIFGWIVLAAVATCNRSTAHTALPATCTLNHDGNFLGRPLSSRHPLRYEEVNSKTSRAKAIPAKGSNSIYEAIDEFAPATPAVTPTTGPPPPVPAPYAVDKKKKDDEAAAAGEGAAGGGAAGGSAADKGDGSVELGKPRKKYSFFSGKGPRSSSKLKLAAPPPQYAEVSGTSSLQPRFAARASRPHPSWRRTLSISLCSVPPTVPSHRPLVHLF